METIRWVETPPCRECSAPHEFARRFSCIGCEKMHRKNTEEKAELKRRLTRADRNSRNKRIAELREQGLSYERIAILLKMPRATVQSAAAAYSRTYV